MNAYILDDERLAVQRLTRLLEATGRVRLAGSSTDPEAALAFLREHAVDVLFLDIQMPGLTGFELLERLDRPVVVIFTTAFDRYALDAFAVNSLDYLLKPIEPERLARALDKLERFAGEPKPDLRALARELAAQLAPGRRLERIASRTGERTTVVEVTRVTHFFSKDKLTFAVSGGREHVVDATLAELETHARSPAFRPDPPRHDRQRPVRAGAVPGGGRRPARPPQGRGALGAERGARSRAGTEGPAGHLKRSCLHRAKFSRSSPTRPLLTTSSGSCTVTMFSSGFTSTAMRSAS